MNTKNKAAVEQIRERLGAAGLPAYIITGTDAEDFRSGHDSRMARRCEGECG